MSESSRDEAFARARASGNVWLNDLFRFREFDRSRKLGFLGRTTPLELFWALVVFILVFLPLWGVRALMGDASWALDFFYSWPASILFGVIAGMFGRRLAYLSPLKKMTGEGTGTWLGIRIRSLVRRISFVVGSPTTYNMYISCAGTADRSPAPVECIEWIGTGRAPRAPFNLTPRYVPAANMHIEEPEIPTADHIFAPRGELLKWTSRPNQRGRLW